MSKRFSGPCRKDRSFKKKAKLSFKEKRKLKKRKENKIIMCGRYSVQKKTLLVANSLVKKNINVDLEQDNFNCARRKISMHQICY